MRVRATGPDYAESWSAYSSHISFRRYPCHLLRKKWLLMFHAIGASTDTCAGCGTQVMYSQPEAANTKSITSIGIKRSNCTPSNSAHYIDVAQVQPWNVYRNTLIDHVVTSLFCIMPTMEHIRIGVARHINESNKFKYQAQVAFCLQRWYSWSGFPLVILTVIHIIAEMVKFWRLAIWTRLKVVALVWILLKLHLRLFNVPDVPATTSAVWSMPTGVLFLLHQTR